MAEAQAPEGSRSGRRPRTRARVGRRRPKRAVRQGLTRGAFLLLALVALGLLAAGLLAARLTIFASGGSPHTGATAAKLTPTRTSSPGTLIGTPIDGTILALSVAENLIAIQPDSGAPVEATVTANSKITRGGSPATLGGLIPGEAVIVTFSAGPHGTLVVARLQDIESVPTNTPSPTYVPNPLPAYYPTPKPKKGPKPKLTPPPAGPSTQPPPSPGSSSPAPG
ncbi:MAG: hypothetical protein ACYCX9_04775 [Candidatus Dormibacteria bacterium]